MNRRKGMFWKDVYLVKSGKSRGFSLMELLLVIAIAAGIFAFSAPYSLNFYRSNLLNEAQSNIIDALQRARHSAVLQKNDSNFGVHVVAGSYTIFQTPDLTYANRVTAQDEVFPVISNITFSGQGDVIFSKLTGLPNATGTIYINYGTLSKGILTDISGVISKINLVSGVGENITEQFTPPSVPRNVLAVTSNASAMVTFDTPTFDGNSVITGYTVTSSPAGGVDVDALTTGLTHLITSLSNGTAYTFTVTATNANGTSPASEPSAPVTPITTPGAPTIGTATVGNASATITFTAPVSNGGATIDYYTALSSPGGITSSTNSATSVIVSGLTVGTAYTFQIYAHNSAGTSTPSSASNSVTPVNTLYWVGGTASWNTASNWSQSSGGAGNGWVPTVSDNVIFNGGSVANCTLDVAAAVNSFNVTTGYTGTITQNASLSISGNLTVSAGTLAVGTQTLAVSGNSTVTGGTVTIGAGATGWSTAGMTIGTGGVVTATGAAKITVSGNWDSSAGVFTRDQSEVWLTGSGNVRTDANYAYPFYKIHMAAPGMTTTLTGLVYVSNTTSGSTGLYWGGGTVNFNGKTLNYRTGAANSLDATGTSVSGTGTLYLQGYYDTTSVLNNLNLGSVGIRLGTTDSAFAISTFSLTGTINTASLNVQGGSVSGKGAILKTNAGLSLTAGTLNFANANWTNKYSSFDGTSGGTINAGTVSIGYTAGDSRINSFTMGSTVWNVSDNWTNYYPSLDKGTSVVNFIGTGGSNTITSSGASFYNLTQNGTGGTYTLQDPLVVSSNLTLTAGTLDTKSAVNNAVTLAGNFSQATTAKFLARSSTITVNGNGTFTANGTLDSTQYNGASLVLNGVNTLTYNNNAGPNDFGFNNLTVGQNGNTTTISSHVVVKNILTVGSGTLTGGYDLYLRGTQLNPLVFDVGSRLSIPRLWLYSDANLNIPTLTNGYDTDIYIDNNGYVTTQTGNITLNTTKSVFIAYGSTKIETLKTDGYNLTVGGDLQIGVGADTSLKKLDATRNVGAGRTSTITVGGNWINKGTGTAPSRFIADNSTVIFNATATGKTITSGSSINPNAFNNVTFNGAGGAWTLQDNLTASGNILHTAGTLSAGGKNITTTGSGNLTISDGALITASGLVSTVYYNQVTVTGTLTPDVTGTYTYVGSYRGVPYWKHNTLNYWVRSSSAETTFVVVDSAPGVGASLAWSGPANYVLIGSYTPSYGAPAGTATVANVTASGFIGSTITVGGNFSASGHAGALLTLNPASAWNLNVAGTAVANFVNAAYSNASGGTLISQTNSINGGNNTNWGF